MSTDSRPPSPKNSLDITVVLAKIAASQHDFNAKMTSAQNDFIATISASIQVFNTEVNSRFESLEARIDQLETAIQPHKSTLEVKISESTLVSNLVSKSAESRTSPASSHHQNSPPKISLSNVFQPPELPPIFFPPTAAGDQNPDQTLSTPSVQPPSGRSNILLQLPLTDPQPPAISPIVFYNHDLEQRALISALDPNPTGAQPDFPSDLRNFSRSRRQICVRHHLPSPTHGDIRDDFNQPLPPDPYPNFSSFSSSDHHHHWLREEDPPPYCRSLEPIRHLYNPDLRSPNFDRRYVLEPDPNRGGYSSITHLDSHYIWSPDLFNSPRSPEYASISPKLRGHPHMRDFRSLERSNQSPLDIYDHRDQLLVPNGPDPLDFCSSDFPYRRPESQFPSSDRSQHLSDHTSRLSHSAAAYDPWGYPI